MSKLELESFPPQKSGIGRQDDGPSVTYAFVRTLVSSSLRALRLLALLRSLAGSSRMSSRLGRGGIFRTNDRRKGFSRPRASTRIALSKASSSTSRSMRRLEGEQRAPIIAARAIVLAVSNVPKSHRTLLPHTMRVRFPGFSGCNTHYLPPLNYS